MSGTGHWGQIDVGKEEIVAWLSRLSRLSNAIVWYTGHPEICEADVEGSAPVYEWGCPFQGAGLSKLECSANSANSVFDSVERDMKVASFQLPRNGQKTSTKVAPEMISWTPGDTKSRNHLKIRRAYL